MLETIRIFKTFNVEKIGAEYGENLRKDLEKVNKYADKIALNQLKRGFTPHTYLIAVKNALSNAPDPIITFENVFTGDLAYGPKRKLSPYKEKVIMQVEPSNFLNFWHPNITANIIADIVNKIKKE